LVVSGGWKHGTLRVQRFLMFMFMLGSPPPKSVEIRAAVSASSCPHPLSQALTSALPCTRLHAASLGEGAVEVWPAGCRPWLLCALPNVRQRHVRLSAQALVGASQRSQGWVRLRIVGALGRCHWGLRAGDGAQRERHAERLEGWERVLVFQTEMVVRKKRDFQHWLRVLRLRVDTGSTRDGCVCGRCIGAKGQGEAATAGTWWARASWPCYSRRWASPQTASCAWDLCCSWSAPTTSPLAPVRRHHVCVVCARARARARCGIELGRAPQSPPAPTRGPGNVALPPRLLLPAHETAPRCGRRARAEWWRGALRRSHSG